MVKPPVQRIYEFESFRFDVAHLMLYRGEVEISLAPKAAQTLLTLIERRGEILSKEELMENIWNDSIVEEANLTQYVHVLRKTLGTAADGKPLIETLRRRGYRFNGDVRCLESQTNGNYAPFVSRKQIADKPETNRRGILLKTLALFVFAGVLVLVISAFLSSRNSALPAVTLKRLTPDRNVFQPTISPDGKYLVFSVQEKEAGKTLRLKDLTSGSEVQIMPDGVYMDLAFSSDSKQIYYLTTTLGGPNRTLVRIPLFGGKPQIILKNAVSPPAVSPDGKRIAIIKYDNGLVVLDENGGETSNSFDSLQANFNPIIWGSQMSWSPDGERVAICGRDTNGQARILDYSVKDKSGKYFSTQNFNEIDDVLWLSDKSGLLITAKEKSGEPYQIWRVAYPSGKTERVTRDFNDYDWMSISADSKTLVIGQNITKTNIWLASFDDLENPKQITFGSEAQDGYRGLAVAPNGKIIFTSPRSGNVDLWQINPDGTNQQPLTDNQGSLNIAPRITSDGRYIVFASSRGGDKPHIWRMDADGQNPLQLTNSKFSEERFFDISTDGNRIFYASANEQKRMTTLQVSINGGEPSALADNYLSSGSIATSPDGKLLMRYVYLPESQQPWKYGIFPVEGGEPLKLLETGAYRNFLRWTADGKAFLYIKPGTAQLWQEPIDGGAPTLVADLKNGALFNFALSPDYKQIVFANGSQFSEAVLIENFKNF